MPDRDCRLAISILFSFSFPARRSFEGTRNAGVFFVNFEEAYRVLPPASCNRLQSLHLNAFWPI